MLETITGDEGTGKAARVANYRIAGKTGTSHKASASGYAASRYVSSFAGFGPVSNPRLVCVVVINDPTGDVYYGGLVAAPLFSKVMTGAMRLMNIPPDNYPTILANAKISKKTILKPAPSVQDDFGETAEGVVENFTSEGH